MKNGLRLYNRLYCGIECGNALQVIHAVFLCALLSALSAPLRADSNDPITMFASDDISFASKDTFDTQDVPAAKVFICVMEKMGRAYKVRRAPISRAGIIMSQPNKALWFPAAIEGSDERKNRLTSSVGNIDIIWLTDKDYPITPGTPAFKEQALVSAYTGSAMAGWLQAENYRFVPGSADRNRMLSMILTGQINGILAADFRDILPSEMRKLAYKNLNATLYKPVPTAFQASLHLAAVEPEFVAQFNKILPGCPTITKQ